MFGLRKGNRWSCLSCKLELRSRSALRRHELIHVPYRERFTCQICNMIISRKDHLWRHMRRVHGVSQPSPLQLALTCPFCLQTMPNMADLERHVDSCHPYANGNDWTVQALSSPWIGNTYSDLPCDCRPFCVNNFNVPDVSYFKVWQLWHEFLL